MEPMPIVLEKQRRSGNAETQNASLKSSPPMKIFAMNSSQITEADEKLPFLNANPSNVIDDAKQDTADSVATVETKTTPNEANDSLSVLHANPANATEAPEPGTACNAAQVETGAGDTPSNVIEVPPDNVTKVETKSAPNEDKSKWKWNLRVVISNLYMDSARRLPDASKPDCMYNTTYCVNNHRRAMLPNAPTFNQSQSLRSHLYGQNYDVFMEIINILVFQNVYPGEGVLNKLVEMAMILVAKDLSVLELQTIYINLRRRFDSIVSTFPPCWTALRPYYLNFFSIDKSLKNRSTKRKNSVQFYFDLLEESMSKCTDEQMREQTPFYEEYEVDYAMEERDNMSPDSVFAQHVQEYQWDRGELSLADYKTMSPGAQLARVCDVLQMLCAVLESDLLMWLDYNRLRQSATEILCEETAPLAAFIFDITPTMYLTPIVSQLFRLYGKAAARSMYWPRLNLLERYIAIVMEISNTAEREYVDNAVRYPHLGPRVRILIGDFFKIFKAENPNHISTYVKHIQNLNPLYLRFEFANLFLQMFYFAPKTPFGPEKVYQDFKERHWLKYKRRDEIKSDDDAELAREDYLDILQSALHAYCEWFGLKQFWLYIKTKTPVPQLQVNGSSPLATPAGPVCGDVGKVFMLDEMEKEASTWKSRINLNTIIERPKVTLPVAKVHLGALGKAYGMDIRMIRSLYSLLRDDISHLADAGKLLDYLHDFLDEDKPATSSSEADT